MSLAAVLSAACGYTVKLNWLKQQYCSLGGTYYKETGNMSGQLKKTNKQGRWTEEGIVMRGRRGGMSLDFCDLSMFHFLQHLMTEKCC